MHAAVLARTRLLLHALLLVMVCATTPVLAATATGDRGYTEYSIGDDAAVTHVHGR